MHAIIVGTAPSSTSAAVADLLVDICGTSEVAFVSREQLDTLEPLRLPFADPDLVVAVQCRPDEFQPEHVSRLIERFPLSRLLCVTGPWCASLGRSYDLWPTAVTVPLPLLPSRLRRERTVIEAQLDPLPLTASPEECFGFAQRPLGTKAPGGPCTVIVDTPDPDLFAFFSDAAPTLGWNVRTPSDKHADLLLLDLDPWAVVRSRRTGRSSQTTDIPVIGLTGEPSELPARELFDCGITACLSKLSPLEDLQTAVQHVVSSHTLSPHKRLSARTRI